MVKVCLKCGLEKDISQYRQAKAKSGNLIYRPECKRCATIAYMAWKKTSAGKEAKKRQSIPYLLKNKDRISKRNKDYREEHYVKKNRVYKPYKTTEQKKATRDIGRKRNAQQHRDYEMKKYYENRDFYIAKSQVYKHGIRASNTDNQILILLVQTKANQLALKRELKRAREEICGTQH